ncbi:hypothetical protein ACNQFN_11090 [Thauera butanivorans]|uniref:hypothetical protein n=1 Tax=Thauera butanivorans TaxID=86174 RepID=UPI003AB2DF19
MTEHTHQVAGIVVGSAASDVSGPTRLDHLAISTPRGQLMAMFGLGGELYVAPHDRAQMRLDMLDVQEDYYLRFKDYLDRCRFPSKSKPDGQIITLKGDNPFPTIRDSMGEWPSDRGYSNELFSVMFIPTFPAMPERSPLGCQNSWLQLK